MKKIQKQILCFIIVFVMIISIFIPAFAISDLLEPLDKEDIIPYTYSDSSVMSDMETLIERTENLKEYYSASEALDILRSLENTINYITYSDYSKNYEIKHDEENYEKGEFYKYKFGHTEWICKNVVYSMIINYTSDTDYIEMAEILYRIAKIEMSNSAISSDIMYILSSFSYYIDDFPASVRDFMLFIGRQAGYDSMRYEENKQPSTDTLTTQYQDYLKQQNKEEQNKQDIINNNSQVEIIQEPEKTEISPFDSSILDNANTSIEYEGSNYKPENPMNTDDYIQKMEDAKNENLITDYNIYEPKTVYYTLDKLSENKNWVNTGITMETETLTYKKFVTILSVIARNEGYYYFEDIDMVMFIANGKNVIINKKEEISENEFIKIFDSFEYLGIAFMTHSEEKDNNSLSTKINKGELTSISVDGNTLVLTNSPILTKNILQLPVSQTAKAIGYNVIENENTITLTKGDISITMKVGSNEFTMNDEIYNFKTEVIDKNNVIYAEFDKIASYAGYQYNYDSNNVIIVFNK